jgi:hypothetical protein
MLNAAYTVPSAGPAGFSVAYLLTYA